MKKIILTTWYFASISISIAFAQDAKKYHEDGIAKYKAGKLKEAIRLFDKSIAMDPKDFASWHDRGVAKGMLKLYKESLPDFEEAIRLNPGFKVSYLSRGIAKHQLTDYNGAIADFNYSLQLDSAYAIGFYNRGLSYEMLHKNDSACADFTRAYSLGFTVAGKKLGECSVKSKRNDTESQPIVLHQEGTISKLLALRPEPVVVKNETLMMITFFLMPGVVDSSLSGSFDSKLNIDKDASVDIKLKNGTSIISNDVAHNSDTANGNPLIFTIFLNKEKQLLLRENDIEKIRFKINDGVYEYAIEIENAGKLKHYL